jgi:hypothetical protein
VRLRLADILGFTESPPEPKMFTVRITAQVIAMLMQTRWIPENNPEYRVKVVGVNEREDGFADILIVGENA